MSAFATQQKVGENGCVGNLILPAQQEAPSSGRFQRLVAVHLLVIFSSCIGMRDWDARPAIAKKCAPFTYNPRARSVPFMCLQ